LACFVGVVGCASPASVEPAALDDAEYDVKLEFPSDKYPETALHIYDAIALGGASAVCTIDRDGADDNREQSLAGIDAREGYDRDEWPMAMCEEGGAGANVAYIDAGDNRGAGAWVGHRLEPYPDGTRVLFVVEKPALTFGKPAAKSSAGGSATPPDADSPYASCAAARDAGAAPLLAGDPGYRAKLDRDGDGVACE
jgi:hypothetical protein